MPTGWPGVDMGNWYTQSLGSVDHEFGHMLGNPDEYFLSADHFQQVTGIDPTTAPAGTVTSQTDAEGTTRYSHSASMMGSSGQVQPRHLNYFVNWLNRHRLPDQAAFRLTP